MAFITTPPAFPTSHRSRTSHRNVTCTAAANRPTNPSTTTSTSPSRSHPPTQPTNFRPHHRAPVIDSRISSVVESHHWIVVKKDHRRLFERAAVAHADMTRQVERRAGSGALHRWVLREVTDPGASYMNIEMKEARYVVMETFKREVWKERPQIMKRWLSAVERVAPMMDTLDIRTTKYENVFTSKLHDAKFDPNKNIVVVESFNVERGGEDHVIDMLRTAAEAAVSSGNCLEFCVLHKPGEQGFFKTIEVYKNVDALKAHRDTLDRVMVRRLQGKTLHGRTGQGHRNRHTFRPVVFS